jgi:hypothetical protein
MSLNIQVETKRKTKGHPYNEELPQEFTLSSSGSLTVCSTVHPSFFFVQAHFSFLRYGVGTGYCSDACFLMDIYLVGDVFDGFTNIYEKISESKIGYRRQDYDNMYGVFVG